MMRPAIIATKEELEHLFEKVSTAFYENMQKYTKPINEAIEFIKKLHARGIKLGIVTADSVTSTNLTLKQFGWEEYFDVVIGRESSTSTKESGIPTIMALEKLNAHPKTTVMIGDSPTDMISAKISKTDLKFHPENMPPVCRNCDMMQNLLLNTETICKKTWQDKTPAGKEYL